MGDSFPTRFAVHTLIPLQIIGLQARRNYFKSSGVKPNLTPHDRNMFNVSYKSKRGQIPTVPVCSVGPGILQTQIDLNYWRFHMSQNISTNYFKFVASIFLLFTLLFNSFQNMSFILRTFQQAQISQYQMS